MKNYIYILFLLFSVLATSQEWEESYADALASAKEQDKNILLVFSGSDWCAPCIKLDKNVWQSVNFTSYAKENLILYKADFPRKKKNALSEEKSIANNVLADKFNSKGYFPLVLLLDKNEAIVGKTGYKNASSSEYVSLLNSMQK